MSIRSLVWVITAVLLLYAIVQIVKANRPPKKMTARERAFGTARPVNMPKEPTLSPVKPTPQRTEYLYPPETDESSSALFGRPGFTESYPDMRAPQAAPSPAPTIPTFPTVEIAVEDNSPAPPDTQNGFQATLEIGQMRREIVQLREQLRSSQEQHRQQIVEIKQAYTDLVQQFDSIVSQSGISPEYNEALVYARRGMEVKNIAKQCGISESEAQLVHALANNLRGTTES